MPNQEEEILKELGRLIGKVEQLEKRLEIIEKQQISQPAEPIPYKEVPEHPSEIGKPEMEEKIIPSPKKKPVDIEEAMGTWLPRIGMLALLFGVGFFLKYAFDNQWVGPTTRIILGLLGGVSLLGAGEYFEIRNS